MAQASAAASRRPDGAVREYLPHASPTATELPRVLIHEPNPRIGRTLLLRQAHSSSAGYASAVAGGGSSDSAAIGGLQAGLHELAVQVDGVRAEANEARGRALRSVTKDRLQQRLVQEGLTQLSVRAGGEGSACSGATTR